MSSQKAITASNPPDLSARSRSAGPRKLRLLPFRAAGSQPQGGAVADDPPGPAGSSSARLSKSRWREFLALFGMVLILSLGIKTFFVQAFSIPSSSMQDTLQPGDRVLVDKLTPWFGATPQRGEVMVFRDPGGWLTAPTRQLSNPALRYLNSALSFVGLMPSADEKDLIKRVIAIGGDTVECRRGSPVEVNGIPLKEPYIYRGATPCDDLPVGTVKVPPGHLWVMGDHRNDSWDSRAHVHEPEGGFVPVDHVIGRAFAVVWPIPRWADLPVIAEHQKRKPQRRTVRLALLALLPTSPTRRESHRFDTRHGGALRQRSLSAGSGVNAGLVQVPDAVGDL